MALKDTNKNLSITVTKEIWDKIEAEAKKECRSVSKQGLLYLLKGFEEYLKEKRG